VDKNDRFKCSCCGQNMMDPRVIHYIEVIEEELKQTLVVTSGYRCEKHNLKEGGSKTSSHLKGLAVDLKCAASRLRFQIMRIAIRLGITRIGIGKTFLHLDIDRQKDQEVSWLY